MKKIISRNCIRSKLFSITAIILGSWFLLLESQMSNLFYAMWNQDGIYIPTVIQNPQPTAKQSSGKFALSATFRLYNLRFRYLTVSAEPDCGCTSTSWQKTTIRPFGWADLTTTMETPTTTNEQKVGVAMKTSSKMIPYRYVFLEANAASNLYKGDVEK